MITETEDLNVSSSIDHMRDTVKSTAEATAEAFQSKADDMKDTAIDLKKQAYHAGIKLRKWVNRAMNQADDTLHKVEDGIRDRPFLSSAALFAAGIITARVITRK